MVLDELRIKIDEINEQIIQLLAERSEVSKQIAEEKKSIGKEIYDPEREAQLIIKIKTLAKEKGLDEDLIENIFKQIMDNSKEIQETI
jgi:chorismate mutase